MCSPSLDAGRGLVSRRPDQLRRARVPREARRACRRRPRRRGRRGIRADWGELRVLTARIAAACGPKGCGAGDRVAAYLPNIPEAVAAFLACHEPRRDVVELLARLRRRAASRIASPRSSRRCCSPSTATATAAATSTAPMWCRAVAAASELRARRAALLGSIRSGRMRGAVAWDEFLGARTATRRSSRSRSITRSGSSIPRARPARRRRSCMDRAEFCSNTSSCSTSTSTRARVTGFSGSRRRAG